MSILNEKQNFLVKGHTTKQYSKEELESLLADVEKQIYVLSLSKSAIEKQLNWLKEQ